MLLLAGAALEARVAMAAGGTVYIRADGSVQGTAYIVTGDNVTYLLTANITATIIVQRDNVVLDGNGHTVQGTHVVVNTGEGSGIDLSGRTNVTVKNTQIKSSSHGVYLSSSSGISILGNNMTNNWEGIWLSSSSGNTIFENNMTNNSNGILFFSPSSGNSIWGNNITHNSDLGIGLLGDNNTIFGNNITNNYYGIFVSDSSGNLIFHNNLVNNTSQQADIDTPGLRPNVWDDGFPSGGNYWGDYAVYYPNASEIDASGIWNTSYWIPGNETDRYPLQNQYVIPEFPSLIMPALALAPGLLTVTLSRRKRSKSSTNSKAKGNAGTLSVADSNSALATR
jgi:parallel beta-helix repeat protein